MKDLFATPITGSLILLVAVLSTLAAAALAVGLATVRADTSGPGASGYVWLDSNAPDPVTTFNWTDVKGTGTLIPSNDCDDCADTVFLPFTFNFFDTNYTKLDIGTNGVLSFDTGNSCNDQYNWGPPPGFPGNPIPHGDVDCLSDGWAGNPLIAPWFDDLDLEECGDVYYDTLGSAPNRMFVIQFDDVCHFDSEAGQGVTFETILFEGSNDIKVQYMDAFFGTGTADLEEENNGGTATAGINLDASAGLQYSYNAPALTDGLAVLFTKQQPTPTPTLTPTPTPTPTSAPAATPTPTLTRTPSPTGVALEEVEQPEALPETGGHPPHGGSIALALLAAVAGAISVMGATGLWLTRRGRPFR